jgi:anaphase-promoting complex subunit 5
MQNRDRQFYQYALMNLAVLQSDFGCYKEAVAAMLETVSTARENRDMTCLNFALNWLFHFGRANPKLVRELESDSLLGTGKESLAYLRVKAKETHMANMWISVLISEAKLGLVNGDSLATSLEYMVRSSQVLLERNLKNMFAQQMSLSIALWERLGLPQLSSMVGEIYLRCHSRHCTFDDELRVTIRLSNLLVAKGKYDEALQKFDSLDENSLRSWKPKQLWIRYRGIIKLRRDLNRNNLDGAEILLAQLLQVNNDDLEPDLRLMIDVMHVEAMMRRGDLGSAFNKVEDLIAELREDNKDIALRVNLLLIKANLYDRCGSPQRGFTIAMRAASLSWKARLIPCLWQSVGAVSTILVSLGEFAAADELLTSILPRSLECGNGSLSGNLYAVVADASMGLAGAAPRRSGKRNEFLARAAQAAEKALQMFGNVGEVERMGEMMAKKAVILKVRGDATLAADCAAAYVALKREAVG